MSDRIRMTEVTVRWHLGHLVDTDRTRNHREQARRIGNAVCDHLTQTGSPVLEMTVREFEQEAP